MLRRIRTTLLLLILLVAPVVAIHPVSAQFEQVCDDRTANSPACAENDDNPIAGEDGVLILVVNILSWVVGVASVIMIILGGLKYVTSNGDSNSVSSAKNTILYAIIGVVVFLMSQTIIIFVIRKL